MVLIIDICHYLKKWLILAKDFHVKA